MLFIGLQRKLNSVFLQILLLGCIFINHLYVIAIEKQNVYDQRPFVAVEGNGTELGLVSSVSSAHNNGPCIVYESDFSKCIGIVANCLAQHGSPVAFCGWCRDHLANLTVMLENRSLLSPSGVPCSELVMGSVNIQPTHQLLNFIAAAWNSSFCPLCLAEQVPFNSRPSMFSSSNKLKTDGFRQIGVEQFYHLQAYNNKTKEFFIRLDKTLNCFSRFFLNVNLSLLDILNFPASEQVVILPEVCTECSEFYDDVISFYEKEIMRVTSERILAEYSLTTYLQDHARLHFAVCLDIQHALNRTQWGWYHLLRCQSKEKIVPGGLLPLLVCLAFVVGFHSCVHCLWRNPVQFLIYRPKRVEPRGLSVQSHGMTLGYPHSIPSYGSIASTSAQMLENHVPHILSPEAASTRIYETGNESDEEVKTEHSRLLDR